AVLDPNVISAMDSQDEKPLASGNGVSMAIHLAEPVLFVQGFENTENSPGNTAMLRGSLHLRVQKSAKIKAVTLRFKGRAITKWPEGIPPRKIEFEEQDTIMSHTWPFFNAQFENAERGTNADHVQLSKGPDGASSTVTRLDPLGRSSPNSSSVNLSAKEARKLSLQVNQSRSFGKGDAAPGAQSVAAKGYRTFLPGDYIYNFELPLDSRLPETIDVDLGSVKYELEAEVTRSGAFRANLVGNKEVTLIRAPAEGSLEQVEPIAISRNWEDQLHYDIVISGKSFPLGTKVPIAFKLTPLAKVQCHRIKVLVTENIEYFCSGKRVHRMEPTRKVQLFEKRADGDPVSTFQGSDMRVTAGGGIPYDARARAARGERVQPQDPTNLLGNLEGDTNIGPTEMEFNVQLPSCKDMRERDRSQRLHFDTTYQNIQVHHWIKIVMRLSKPDLNDPSKRRHFEISIDSPFHILSCQATQANISLPAYSAPEAANGGVSLHDCGCPGANVRRNSPTSFLPTLNALNSARTSRDDDGRPTTPTLQTPNLTRPQQAHVHGQAPGQERPIHLLRAPSFNPPAFEDEQPPPPLITPPPQYDDIASPTSGLADYFSRLADTYDSDDDENTRNGRVNVPLTPVAIVGLVDGGLSLSKDLKDKIDTYRNAEREVTELAHEVDLCTTLLEVFGQSLDRAENLPRNVIKQTERLIVDMRTVFTEIRTLLEKFDSSIRASAKYLVNAGALREQHSKIKSLQLSFIFMLSVCPPQARPANQVSSVNTAGMGALGGPGSFEGTIQHLPIQGSSSRDPFGNVPVTYQATLTLHPVSSGQHHPQAAPASGSAANAEPDLTQHLDELRRNKRLKKKLENLTSNPFFSRSLFGDIFSSKRAGTGITSRRYGGPDIEPRQYVGRVGSEGDLNESMPAATDYSYTEPMMGGPESEIGEDDRVASREARSERDVDDILSYLFNEDEETGDDGSSTAYPDVPGTSTSRGSPRPAATAYTGAEMISPDTQPGRSPPYGTLSPPSVDPRTGPAIDREPPPPEHTPARQAMKSPGNPGPANPEAAVAMAAMSKSIAGDTIRYECASCKDIDFCEECFRDPEQTVRHRHSKRHFVTRLPNRSWEE
ncbi:hypothetical protein B0A55_02433, partial [Friedmanniomyces simplex]